MQKNLYPKKQQTKKKLKNKNGIKPIKAKLKIK